MICPRCKGKGIVPNITIHPLKTFHGESFCPACNGATTVPEPTPHIVIDDRRTYLAGCALIGYLASSGDSNCSFNGFAKDAAMQADALIAELDKEKE